MEGGSYLTNSLNGSMMVLRSLRAPIIAVTLAVTTVPGVGLTARAAPAEPEKPSQIKPKVGSGEVPGDADNDDGSPLFEIPEDALPSLDRQKPDDAEVFASPPSDGPPPKILRDPKTLPVPVGRMRDLILEIARKGDIEKLRNLLGVGENATVLSLGGLEGDPIDYLKEASGDDKGYEILGILVEVLEAGFVHLDEGTDEEIYLWPYFAAYPLDKLTPQQNIELYTILTAGDVEESVNFGGYVFYRVGIKPDGEWSFFVAGD